MEGMRDASDGGFLGLDRGAASVLLLLGALAAVQMVYYYPRLPERLAVHFGASGAANGWSDKAGFAAVYLGMEILMVLFGLGFAIMLDRIPDQYFNVPNRDYWFSEERRDDTIEFVRTHILWIEAATVAFFIAVAQVIFMTNLGGHPPRLSNDFLYLVAAFVGVVLWLAARILLRFRSPHPQG